MCPWPKDFHREINSKCKFFLKESRINSYLESLFNDEARRSLDCLATFQCTPILHSAGILAAETCTIHSVCVCAHSLPAWCQETGVLNISTTNILGQFILCTGCLAASQVTAQQMSVVTPSSPTSTYELWQPKLLIPPMGQSHLQLKECYRESPVWTCGPPDIAIMAQWWVTKTQPEHSRVSTKRYEPRATLLV